jgi:hypothetical protein
MWAGITAQALAWHFVLRNEFVFQTILDVESPSQAESESRDRRTGGRPQGQIMTVIDVKGISVSDVTSDVLRSVNSFTLPNS